MLELKPNLRLALFFTVLASNSLFGSFSSDWGSLPLQVFSPKTYDAHPQVWSSVQDNRGVMYFANPDGVLEFDGVTWRRIPIPGNAAVRSVTTDSQGRIAVGAQAEFGFLEHDEHGLTTYRSLLALVKPEDRRFSDVWSVFSIGSAVYFNSNQRIFRYESNGSLRVWRPTKGSRRSFGRAYNVNGTVMVLVRDIGLFRLNAQDELQPVPGGDLFSQFNDDIRSVFTWNGKLTVATREGLFAQVHETFKAVRTDADALFSEDKIYTVLPVAGGNLVIGTSRGGLIVLDGQGHMLTRVDKAHGLPADYVLSLYSDRQGGVWVTTSFGLARFELGATVFDERRGLEGGAVAVARHAGVLYAGTQTGSYALTNTGSGQLTFVPVSDLPEASFVLLPTSSGVLAGAVKGLYFISGTQAKLVYSTRVVFDLQYSPRDPAVLYAVGRDGLSVLKETTEGWTKLREVRATGEDFRSVREDADGKVWVATRSAVMRIDLSQSTPVVEQFGPKEGVPPGWNAFFFVDHKVVLATEKGLLRFNPTTKLFTPENRFGDMLGDGSHPVTLMKEDRGGNIWVSGKGYHGVLTRTTAGSFQWKDMPLLQSGLTELWAVHFDEDGVIWAAGPEGWAARIEPSSLQRPPPSLNVLLRAVRLRDLPTALYAGSGAPQSRSKVSYPDNTLRFEFSLPFYEPEHHAQYQVWLEGADKGWSGWLGETWKDYTHLTEGNYIFHVRARHPLVAGTPEATFSFRVLPPWYRTIWAYILYAFAAAGAIWLLVRWRIQRLRASNVRLEALVEERTEEIRRGRDQIAEQERKTEALLLNILPEPVAAELLATGAVEPKSFDDVTVCFTDFVGFTLSGRGLDARVVVDALHDYFSAFDQVMSRYGLEKLKTIGDAYMFVAGLPETRPSHAVDSILAALEIADIVEEVREKQSHVTWTIRIGANSGPVAAGVVGTRKFTFDIWGDTVNLASRCETCSEPGRVNISAKLYEHVKDFIRCEYRGLVRTKEGSEYDMYFACEVLPELAGEDHNMRPFSERYMERFGTLPRAVPQTKRRTLAHSQ